METTGIYIHIPFCAAKCDYCDFLSYANAEQQWEAYCNALVLELSNYTPTTPIDSIYIGGGTPTVWPAVLLSKSSTALPKAIEFTCEANPSTLNDEKIATLLTMGVNRISLGLQAWQPHLLQAIGRRDYSFAEAFNALRRGGFSNISIDLMFALPGQTMEDWEETLSQVVNLQPEHISAYGLTLEESTPLYSRFKGFDEKLDRQMYHYCKDFLQKQGYNQYELSNFCKPGYESIHNLRYWQRKAYRGFGLGAHSFENNQRWNNTTDLKEYLNGKVCKENVSTISEKEAEVESMILGLRMTKGVKPIESYRLWIEKMKSDGLLVENTDRIFLSDRGMDLANIVMAGFLEA